MFETLPLVSPGEHGGSLMGRDTPHKVTHCPKPLTEKSRASWGK